MNVYKKDYVKCEICGYETDNHQSFNSHITHAHKIKSKDYYDTYIKPNDGKCKTRGKQTKFINMWKGYRTFCCNSCMSSNKDIQEQRKQTSLDHYGVEFPHSSNIVKQNMEQTCLAKYGAKNVYASEYGKQKIKETNLRRYGAENPWSKGSSVIHKSQDTFEQRTGVRYPGQNRESRLKGYKTMAKNGKRSSLENLLEQFFIDNNIKYESEYNLDPRYPFHCDFYLPDSDTFIEINGFWTHGGHWFDVTNIDDINRLNKLKQKSNNNLYTTAIDVWTISDPLKHKTAIDNKLNYIVLWNKTDVDNFIHNFNL